MSELTEIQQALKQRVEAAMSILPRFVFRVWSSQSGGYPRLNSTTAITPLAFSPPNKKQKPPSSFYQLKPANIASLANMHITSQTDRPTIFSSWSQSLALVLTYAKNKEMMGNASYVSILDTTLLDSSVIMLHTEQMADVLENHHVYSHPEELLAYGVISGPAYQAVPFREIYTRIEGGNGTTLFWNNLSSGITADLCRAVISLYNHNFKLAMAAYCVVLCTNVEAEQEARQRLISGLADLKVPAEWQHDPKIMNLENSLLHRLSGGSKEAIEAAVLIRSFVRAALSVRPLREVLGLRIEARGWDKPSTRLRGGR